MNRIPELLAEKEIRDKKRYAQRDMAQGTGLTDTAISRFMRYETLDNVSFGSILKIAEWLEVDPRDLVEVVDVNDNRKDLPDNNEDKVE